MQLKEEEEEEKNLACDGSGLPHEGDLGGGLDPAEAVSVGGDVLDLGVRQGRLEGVELEIGGGGSGPWIMKNTGGLGEHLRQNGGGGGERKGAVRLEEAEGGIDVCGRALPEDLVGMGVGHEHGKAGVGTEKREAARLGATGEVEEVGVLAEGVGDGAGHHLEGGGGEDSEAARGEHLEEAPPPEEILVGGDARGDVGRGHEVGVRERGGLAHIHRMSIDIGIQRAACVSGGNRSGSGNGGDGGESFSFDSPRPDA